MTDEGGLAARLKEARLAKGLTVRDWADLLGNDVKPGQVTDVERGKQKPPQGMLAGAVQNAGVAPVWLLTGAGPMLATGKRAGMAETMAALQAASLKVAALGLDVPARQLAQEWLVAVDTGDVALIQRLAANAEGSTHAAAEPAAKYAATLDAELLARVVGAVLPAAQRLDPPATPGLIARVIAALYEMGGQGLDVDDRAARAALKLAGAS